MFGPLRERIEAAVEKLEGMLVSFSLSLNLTLFCFQNLFFKVRDVGEKELKVGCAGVWCANG